MFRAHDVGEKGHVVRLAGKMQSGKWDTQKWLISKEDAHIEGERLIADTRDAREIIETLKPHHLRADVFEAGAR